MTKNLTYQESDLVALLKEKDERGFSYLYDHYAGALNGIILQIIPDQNLANDILQEVFVNIWRKIDTYDASKGRIFTWMLNIARNAAIDMARSKGFQNSQRNREFDHSVYNKADNYYGDQLDHLGLTSVINELREEHRELIELSFLKGYTHEEIAASLEIPLGTVKTRIRAALLQMRKLMS